MDDIQTKKIYELGYHLLSTLSEADVAKFQDDVKAAIAKHEGEVISEMTPELIRLAYTMFKVIENKRIAYETAHFGVIKFEGTIELMEEIAKMVKASKAVLRHLLVGTVREDTLAKKRPMKGIQKVVVKDETVETLAVEPVEDTKEDEIQSRINKLVEEDLVVDNDE